MYHDIIAQLREAYDRMAGERDTSEPAPWKLEERQRFLTWLQQEGKATLLEIGAGTGRDSLFFQDQGLAVTCIDLSPANVELCRAKGLEAYVMDFLNLAFPDRSFDAVYALNCLLHVPKADLPIVLQKIRQVLKPDGLFYMGLYGGADWDGPLPNDRYEPKRFFSFHTDEGIRQLTAQFFELLYFKRIPVDRERDDFHFQSMILRRQ